MVAEGRHVLEETVHVHGEHVIEVGGFSKKPLYTPGV
jgi:hypothetical protein